MEKQRIKMVVTDLDDTLLSREKEISDEAVQAIAKLQDKGVAFTFITGRPPYAIERFAQRVRITAPVVACNGAMLVDNKTGETSEEISFNLNPWKKILYKAREQGHTILILAGNVEYTLSETSWTRKREEAGRKLPVAELDELLVSREIYKVNIMEDTVGKAPFELLIPEIQKMREKYSIALYGTSGCEVVAKSVNKETGLKSLCRKCGVSLKAVLAVGDNENDLQMLKAAGIGAAVGNAVEHVKEAADYVCEKGYTEGVLEAIEKFV